MEEVQGNGHFQISKVISADMQGWHRPSEYRGKLVGLRPSSDKYLDVPAPNDPGMTITLPDPPLVVLVPIGQSWGS
jgi:hypothetical protein